MGYITALDIANTNTSLEEQITWHLQSNHYPPVPTTMVQPCIEAIDAYFEDNLDAEITLPDGVYYRGRPTAPARAIIIQHHLDAWLTSEEDE